MNRGLLHFAVSLYCLAAFLTPLKLYALPAEGFETSTLNKSGGNHTTLHTLAGYTNPSWTSDYELAQIYGAIPVLGNNYLSFGFSGTTGNKFADRNAYFIRYDQTFYNQSVSLKLIHIDENFIKTGKNIISADYNLALKLGSQTTIYTAIGMYYRFNLNRWNTPTWSPTNFNTEDKEYYFEGTLGFKRLIGQKNFFTMDLNNRDAFNSYNGDFVAFDVSLNFAITAKSFIRLVNSTRFSAFFMGTADVGQETLLIGLTSEI